MEDRYAKMKGWNRAFQANGPWEKVGIMDEIRKYYAVVT